MKLRKYQEEAVAAVFAAWEKCRRVLIVLPTGCGKTVVFASVIKKLMTELGLTREADEGRRRAEARAAKRGLWSDPNPVNPYRLSAFDGRWTVKVNAHNLGVL